VTIQVGLKHAFLFPSQICHLSRKREAGRPFGLRPTLKKTKQHTLKTVENAQSSLGLFLNKVREGVVARGRWCAQRNRSVLKRNHLLLFFCTSYVLGLCQDPAPHTKMVERRLAGSVYKTVGQCSQELERPPTRV